MMMTKRHIWIIVVSAALAVILAAGWFVGRKIYDRKASNFNSSAELFIYPGQDWNEIGAFLTDSCDIRWKASIRRCIEEVSGSDPRPGHYVIPEGSTSTAAARMLSHGWQTPVKLVLSGTMRLRGGIARKISAQMLLDSAAVASALEDPELLNSFGFRPDNVFSLFMPDTYQVLWTDGMEEILRRQKQAYDAFWTTENKDKARRQGLSVEEVSILASIVKGETNYEPEMPKIAGVYLNRLRKGMKLQADPTIAFCYDYTLNRILKKHLKIESPYNTYKHYGLPPGPICVPTRACLEAVLNPDSHGYLYFCASPDMDGTHLFATNFVAHMKNARAFQRALTNKLRNAS